jgi:hypothetical protein
MPEARSDSTACRPPVAVRPGLVDTDQLRDALTRTPLTNDALDAITAPVDPDDVAALNEIS